jgi:hypothetical protein
MELSVSTIVIIVLAVTMLIMGMLLVRSIMCAGMGLTKNIEDKMQSELLNLFGDRDFGVRCMGASGQDRPNLADGMTQEIFCVIREDRATPYILNIKEIKPISGESEDSVSSWIIDDSGWSGTVGVGNQIERVAILDVPRGVSKTTLRIVVEEYRGNSSAITRTHSLLVDITSSGAVTRAMC